MTCLTEVFAKPSSRVTCSNLIFCCEKQVENRAVVKVVMNIRALIFRNILFLLNFGIPLYDITSFDCSANVLSEVTSAMNSPTFSFDFWNKTPAVQHLSSNIEPL
jgi:hypothetical protein